LARAHKYWALVDIDASPDDESREPRNVCKRGVGQGAVTGKTGPKWIMMMMVTRRNSVNGEPARSHNEYKWQLSNDRANVAYTQRAPKTVGNVFLLVNCGVFLFILFK